MAEGEPTEEWVVVEVVVVGEEQKPAALERWPLG